MDSTFHREITREALQPYLEPKDLEVVVEANLRQDSVCNLIGHPELHFDDSQFAAGIGYVEEQRRRAAAAIQIAGDRRAALQSLGRLLHGCQDFYAHSNWVRLWVEQNGGLTGSLPGQIEICQDPLVVPGLISGTGKAWRYLLYRAPLLGRLAKRFYLPSDSHEAMNLDNPGQGPLFPFAVAAATKHTRWELAQLLEAIEEETGSSGIRLFLGAGSMPDDLRPTTSS